jgi:anthranilate phosphoribosyltransferase
MKYDEAYEVFNRLFENQMSEDEARGLLSEMYKRGESAEEIAAGAKVMREHCKKLEISDSLKDKIIDNCGTGGDKSGSFNISTTVSIVLASCGCYVAKHGNRSITSQSGSADMLEALGVNLSLSLEKLPKMLQQCGFIFMFAINHHPAMKYIMPIRKSLSHRTIFNILGPLTNPAGAKKQLIGVFDKDYIQKIAKALLILGTKRSMVVSSNDGLDEISISDITYACTLVDGKIKDELIDPRDFGFKLYSLQEIKGGDAKSNAKITLDILRGDESGAKRDIVLLNAAAALFVDGLARDIKEGIEIAKESIDSGKSLEKLKEIIKVSNGL